MDTEVLHRKRQLAIFALALGLKVLDLLATHPNGLFIGKVLLLI